TTTSSLSLLSSYHYSAPLSYILSFPTRRSSDLLLSKRPRAIKYSNIYHQFPAIWTDYLKDCTVEEQKDALRLLGELINVRHLSVDRKSTRLNSSHVSISYAVFCLKKKNYEDNK